MDSPFCPERREGIHFVLRRIASNPYLHTSRLTALVPRPDSLPPAGAVPCKVRLSPSPEHRPPRAAPCFVLSSFTLFPQLFTFDRVYRHQTQLKLRLYLISSCLPNHVLHNHMRLCSDDIITCHGARGGRVCGGASFARRFFYLSAEAARQSHHLFKSHITLRLRQD